MIPYGRQDITQADIDAVVAVLQSDYLTQGPAVPGFEQAVAKHVGGKHALAVNSATSALHIACLALGVGPGDWLWTTPVRPVVSARQKAANRANSLKSSGPRSEEGKFRAKLNASKHGLSLPIDERVFADQIKTIAQMIRDDCETDAQAAELAKRIIDFERNEEFLQNFNEKALHDEIKAWGFDPRTIALQQLAQAHRNKQKVSTTFTLPQKDYPVKLKGKERTEEIKFLEGFLRLESNAILDRIRAGKNIQLSALRYQPEGAVVDWVWMENEKLA